MKNEINSIKIAIMGAGTVGGGVYKVLQMRKDDMVQRAGTDIEIKKILWCYNYVHRRVYEYMLDKMAGLFPCFLIQLFLLLKGGDKND